VPLHLMTHILSRISLGVAAMLLLFGGTVHTRAFEKAVTAVSASNLAPFFAKAFKALWLIDSTMLFTSAIIFGLVAFRPALASSVIVALVAVMPAVVAALLYSFVGAIVPAHLLVVASILGFAGALLRTSA
jgi:hypothetical protein